MDFFTTKRIQYFSGKELAAETAANTIAVSDLSVNSQ
jgi:hypothetical protein